MTEIYGPEVAQTVFKPVYEIADSKKNEDGVSFKTAGSYGSTEFTIDELVQVYRGIQEFLKEKGLDPDAEVRASQFLDKGFLGDSLQEGESVTITGGPHSFTIHGSN